MYIFHCRCDRVGRGRADVVVCSLRGRDGMERAYIVGTLDTKGEELLYIRDLLAADGVAACVVDVGTGGGRPAARRGRERG